MLTWTTVLGFLKQIAEVSPYIFLPAFFIFVIWKMYVANNAFIKDLLADKSTLITALNDQLARTTEASHESLDSNTLQLSQMTDTINKALYEINIEIVTQNEKYAKDIHLRIDRVEQKIDALRLEIASQKRGA